MASGSDSALGPFSPHDPVGEQTVNQGTSGCGKFGQKASSRLGSRLVLYYDFAYSSGDLRENVKRQRCAGSTYVLL